MKTALPRPPLGLRAQVGWDFCLRGADEKWPGLDRKGFMWVGLSLATLSAPTGGTSLFPAKREVKGKLAKRGRRGQGTRLPEKVLLEVLLEGGGANAAKAVKSGSFLAARCFLHESILAPFSPF